MKPEASTIPAALLRSAKRDIGGYTFHLDDGSVSLSYPELAARAELGARQLVARGVEPGDAVGVLGPNRPEWIVAAFAAWRAGAALVPIQIPLRIRNPEAFAQRLREIVAAAECRLVLADRRLAGFLDTVPAAVWDEAGEQSDDLPQMPTSDDVAVIQFTSGSTSAPKGAVLTHAAVMAQMEILRLGYRYADGAPRSVLAWTPFFHDLGLFANVVHPAYAGSTTYHLPTERFARDPLEWLRLIGRERPAGTIAPSSAFGRAFSLARRRGETIDLSSLEGAYFAAEGVDPEVVRDMIEMGQQFGLGAGTLASTYGLAEAVMAASYPPVGTGIRIDRVSTEDLVASGLATPSDGDRSRSVISCGEPLMDLRIIGSDGEQAERHIGEIQLRGPSLMSHYLGQDVPDPFDGGWLRTGDLGYLADGELFVTGRVKDMVISMGENYYPEDFEWAAARVSGVRTGRCVAFGDPDGERIVVVVEPKDAGGDLGELERSVRRSVKDAIGVTACKVVVVPRDTVEKTTSGKLRRANMRDSYKRGELATASV